MSSQTETPPLAAKPGAAQKTFRNSSAIINKLPPYAKALIDRQRFDSPPFLAVVCVGSNAWQDSKRWRRIDIDAVVLPAGENPNNFTWPIKNCTCVVDWSNGPGIGLIVSLVSSLLAAGAASVTVFPSFVDLSKPAMVYEPGRPIDERFVQLRQTARTYRGGQ